MSRSIKHHIGKAKGKMPKPEKGTKNTMRLKYLKELDEEEYDDAEKVV